MTYSKLFIISENIYCPQINNISTRYIINKKASINQAIQVQKELVLSSPKFENSLVATKLKCNLTKTLLDLTHLDQMYWNNVHVSKSINIEDPKSKLNKLLKNAVNADKDNIITGQVRKSIICSLML